jgi:hypothetical protein
MGYKRMRNKHDMYIDYRRSYKKRGRRGRSKLGIVLILFLIALGVGFAAYQIIRIKMNTDKSSEQISPTPQQQTDVNPTVTITPTVMPTIQPTVQPTPLPTGLNTEVDTRTAVKVKGVYVSAAAAGSASMDELIELVDTTELNAMVIDVKDDYGRLSFAMDSAMANEIGAARIYINDIDAFLSKLKAKNIYAIARIVTFKDPYLAEKRQDLAIKNPDGSIYRDGNGEGWVNPYNHEVWDYVVDIASQAASAGFDEIQFDYIRFSTGNGMKDADFGEEAENKSKEDIIIEFTKYAYEKIKPLGVFVSADVYGTIISSSIDAGLVGQNYVEMAKYLDYICPMIYPSHFGDGNYGIQYPDLEPYNIIRKVLTASKSKLDAIPEGEHRAVVRPWLQDFTATWIKHHMEYGENEIKEQIRGVYEVGYEEWLLWNGGANYTVEGLIKE